MKKLLLGVVLTGVASICFAEQPLVTSKSAPEKLQSTKVIKDVEEKLAESYCMIVLSVAETSMKAKQSGMSIKKALEVSTKFFANDKNDEFNLEGISKQMIMDAYAQPDYWGEEYKKRQLNEFTAKHYLTCMKAAGLN